MTSTRLSVQTSKTAVSLLVLLLLYYYFIIVAAAAKELTEGENEAVGLVNYYSDLCGTKNTI